METPAKRAALRVFDTGLSDVFFDGGKAFGADDMFHTAGKIGRAHV